MNQEQFLQRLKKKCSREDGKFKVIIDQENYVVQHIEPGNFFFEGCKTAEEAIEQDWEECFYIDEEDQLDSGTPEDEVLSYKEQRENHACTFEIYTKDQVLELAKEGESWPFDCGILEDIDSDE